MRGKPFRRIDWGFPDEFQQTIDSVYLSVIDERLKTKNKELITRYYSKETLNVSDVETISRGFFYPSIMSVYIIVESVVEINCIVIRTHA